jgi:two-component system OmpR family response regulator
MDLREPVCKTNIGLHHSATMTPIVDMMLWASRSAKMEIDLRLLVVEDDKDLNRQMATALGQAGYVVDCAFDGEEGWFLGDTEPYDAVVLDLGLPKKDGISVIADWRKAGRIMPVLILTARDRWSDKVQGFDAGADDYVAKPFHMEEVLARLRALLRRAAGHASSEFNCGPVSLDTRAGRVTVDGNPIKLTSHEYRLLAYLMHQAGRVVSRSEIVEHLYDQDFDRDSNTIEVFVGRLRKKLGVDIIQTMRGLGYCLTQPAASENEANSEKSSTEKPGSLKLDPRASGR